MAPGASFGLVTSDSCGIVLAVSSGFPQCLVWWESLGYPHWVPPTALKLVHGALEVCMSCPERTLIPAERLCCPVCHTPSALLTSVDKSDAAPESKLDATLRRLAESLRKRQPPVMYAYSRIISRQ